MNVTVLNVYGRTWFECFPDTLVLPTSTSQTAIFGILDSVTNNLFENNQVLVNHILFTFKLYVYKSREKKFIKRSILMAEIQKDRIKIAPNNSKKTIAFITK